LCTETRREDGVRHRLTVGADDAATGREDLGTVEDDVDLDDADRRRRVGRRDDCQDSQ
jgi:hypothetical protein